MQVDWDDSDRDGGDDILENLRRNFISTLNQAGDSVRLSILNAGLSKSSHLEQNHDGPPLSLRCMYANPPFLREQPPPPQFTDPPFCTFSALSFYLFGLPTDVSPPLLLLLLLRRRFTRAPRPPGIQGNKKGR